MKNRILVVLMAMFFVLPLQSQHLIGKSKEQVVKEIKSFYPDFVIDRSSVNNTYKYLKYIDKFNDQTFLVFLSDKDICTSTKLMSDYSNLDQVKQDLNKRFKAAGKDQWAYTLNGVLYMVKLKREEWFFCVFTSKKP